MAAVLQQRLGAAEQAAVTAGDQCQPPVVHQGSCWQWQGLLQQGAVAEDRAAGDLIAQGQLPERWGVAADAVPLPKAFSQGIPFGVDQLSIAMDEQRLRAASGVTAVVPEPCPEASELFSSAPAIPVVG